MGEVVPFKKDAQEDVPDAVVEKPTTSDIEALVDLKHKTLGEQAEALLDAIAEYEETGAGYGKLYDDLLTYLNDILIDIWVVKDHHEYFTSDRCRHTSGEKVERLETELALLMKIYQYMNVKFETLDGAHTFAKNSVERRRLRMRTEGVLSEIRQDEEVTAEDMFDRMLANIESHMQPLQPKWLSGSHKGQKIVTHGATQQLESWPGAREGVGYQGYRSDLDDEVSNSRRGNNQYHHIGIVRVKLGKHTQELMVGQIGAPIYFIDSATGERLSDSAHDLFTYKNMIIGKLQHQKPFMIAIADDGQMLYMQQDARQALERIVQESPELFDEVA